MKVETKICGLTNADDARAALEAGADYIGFVLYPKSPRAVRLETVPDILGALPPAKAVVVVVNLERQRVQWLLERCKLHAVQFHGDEDPGACLGLGVQVWRAVSFRDGLWVPDPDGWEAADRLVVDAPAPTRYGGSGERADWGAAAKLAAARKVMLAGGLNPDNVASAVRVVKPCGVDVASGVERFPGRKDHAAVRRFIEAVREAGRQEKE